MDKSSAGPERITVQLRSVAEDDLPVFFAQQLDPEANHMAAFTAKDPADWAAFKAHWGKILGDKTLAIQTILWDDEIAGYVLSHEWFEDPEISYWIGKKYWGKGIATRALSLFLELQQTRPLYAHVARDNLASLRVLEKCGFAIAGGSKGYSNARGVEVEELILTLA